MRNVKGEMRNVRREMRMEGNSEFRKIRDRKNEKQETVGRGKTIYINKRSLYWNSDNTKRTTLPTVHARTKSNAQCIHSLYPMINNQHQHTDLYTFPGCHFAFSETFSTGKNTLKTTETRRNPLRPPVLTNSYCATHSATAQQQLLSSQASVSFYTHRQTRDGPKGQFRYNMHIIGQTMKRIKILVCVCMTDKHDAGLAAAAGLRPISDLAQTECWYTGKHSPQHTDSNSFSCW